MFGIVRDLESVGGEFSFHIQEGLLDECDGMLHKGLVDARVKVERAPTLGWVPRVDAYVQIIRAIELREAFLELVVLFDEFSRPLELFDGCLHGW
jgi:hypothetical protein